MNVMLDGVFEETMVFITKPGVEHRSPFGNVKVDRNTVFDSSPHPWKNGDGADRPLATTV